jgi:hypothetical protein
MPFEEQAIIIIIIVCPTCLKMEMNTATIVGVKITTLVI